jgi:hypothetical protein
MYLTGYGLEDDGKYISIPGRCTQIGSGFPSSVITGVVYFSESVKRLDLEAEALPPVQRQGIALPIGPK